MNTPARWFSSLAVCFALVPGLAADDGHQHGPASGEKLGTVKFPTSCSAAVRAEFERGVAMLHSFWYEEAEKTFLAVAQKDPGCAMAHWGVALSLYHPLWAPPDAAQLARAGEALQAARAAKRKTPRETAYLAAVEAYYSPDRADYRDRALAYEKAMEQVYLRHPKDREAAAFYALSLLGTALPSDKTYANQKKAGAILEKIFAAQPLHPGVAHYLIHSYDYPALAQRGLNAAQSYARIAPSVPHALHMPSHIFIRLGLWQDAIASNQASAQAAREYGRKMGWDGAWDQQLHAMDYLAYAYLQSGHPAEARRVLEELRGIKKVYPDSVVSNFAFAATPARIAIELRQWDEAAKLEPRPGTSAWAAAMVHWARAVGAARSGQLDAAQQDVARLAAFRDQLQQATQPYWADQVEIQRRSASAWLAFARGDQTQALELMRSSADLEDSTEKHPATPGAITPAREMLGELLVELGKPAEALQEYEASLKNSPNRFNGLYGAARAAELAGNRARAREHYDALLGICGKDNHERRELDHARAFAGL
jgi:tetratricopeptide (TPR) repeat protein